MFATTECVDRVKEVDAIVQGKGKPWFAHYGLTIEQLHSMRACEYWHYEYGEDGCPTGPARPHPEKPAATKTGKDQVY